jgi:hypothetical protein
VVAGRIGMQAMVGARALRLNHPKEGIGRG